MRTSAVATVSVRYGTQPDLSTFQTSASLTTASANDFTKIIPLTNLTPETPYYLNVVVNGVAQNTAPFPTFTTFAPTGVGRDFKFVVLSDFVNVKNLTATSQTFASAAAESPAFVFIGGDFDHRNPANIIQKRMMFQELYDPALRLCRILGRRFYVNSRSLISGTTTMQAGITLIRPMLTGRPPSRSIRSMSPLIRFPGSFRVSGRNFITRRRTSLFSIAAASEMLRPIPTMRTRACSMAMRLGRPGNWRGSSKVSSLRPPLGKLSSPQSSLTLQPKFRMAGAVIRLNGMPCAISLTLII